MSIEIDEDSDEQRPVRNTLWASLQRDWKCLILTFLIGGCLAAIGWCRIAEVTRVVVNFSAYPIARTRRSSPCEDGYVYIPVAFLAMLYLVYLVECWHSPTRLELAYRVDASTVYERIRSMREALPIVWWKAVCYHYVRRTRHVTRYRNGDAFTSTQVYYERINSHAAGSTFLFAHCGVKDISKKLVDLESFAATKIRFSKGFAFATLDAADEFEEQRARFFRDHERRDDYMEMREGLEFMNVHFREYMMAFASSDSLPCYVSQVAFWLASFLLLSWPLRVLIESKTAYVHYHVTKLFGTNYAAAQQQQQQQIPPTTYEGRTILTSSSTVTSADIEWNIRNNFTLVPTYSEALLMDDDDDDEALPLRGPMRSRETTDVVDCNGSRFVTSVSGENFLSTRELQPLSRTRSSSYHGSRPTPRVNTGGENSIPAADCVPSNRHSHRHSWGLFSGGSTFPRDMGFPACLTRMSLHNGHVVYRPLPLWEVPRASNGTSLSPARADNNNANAKTRLSPTSFGRRFFLFGHHRRENPPDYDVAIQVSRPVVRGVNPPSLMRRSRTAFDGTDVVPVHYCIPPHPSQPPPPVQLNNGETAL